MDRTIIKENFWIVGCQGDRSLAKEDLGWPKTLKEDACSDYSETIFRYVIEVVGFNLLFYWTRDENFYVIETENLPIEVRRLPLNPEWDGKYEFQKADSNDGPTTASSGEILATFDEPTEIWNNLKINGIPIEQVIDESMIITWD